MFFIKRKKHDYIRDSLMEKADHLEGLEKLDKMMDLIKEEYELRIIEGEKKGLIFGVLSIVCFLVLIALSC